MPARAESMRCWRIDLEGGDEAGDGEDTANDGLEHLTLAGGGDGSRGGGGGPGLQDGC